MNQFNPIGDDYISRNFNDRRISGKQYRNMPKSKEQHFDMKGSPYRRPPEGGIGGTKVPRKPKPPKTPMPARAVAVKHEIKGY